MGKCFHLFVILSVLVAIFANKQFVRKKHQKQITEPSLFGTPTLPTTTTTTVTPDNTIKSIKSLPIISITATASPLLSLRKDLNNVERRQKQTSVKTQKKIKSSTEDPPSLITRRYETPPPRTPLKPFSSPNIKISSVTKEPKKSLPRVGYHSNPHFN